MGLVVIRSYDNLGEEEISGYNDGHSSWLNIGSSTPRFPGRTYLDSYVSNSYGARALLAETNDVIIGCAFRLGSLDNHPDVRLYVGGGGTIQNRCMGHADGSLNLYVGGTIVASSAIGLLPLNTWHYLEFRCYSHASSGVMEARLNGKKVVDFSGDTYYTDDAFGDAMFKLAGSLADLYVMDLNTAGRNDFLGPVVVDCLLPDADGTHEDWDPSTGSDNYAMVDESVPDADTTYVESDVDGAKDSYSMEDLAPTPQIYGIAVRALAKRTDAGEAGMSLLVRSGGVDYEGDEEALPEDYAFVKKIWESDPDTSNDWTETTIDNAEFGMVAKFTTTTTV